MHFEQKVLNVLVWKSKKICENRTLRVRKINFLAEILKYPQIFIFFVLTAKNKLRKVVGSLMKSVLVFSTVTFWGKLVSWRVLFFFPDFECKFYPLWQNKIGEFVKTSLRVSAIFLEKKEFFELFKVFFFVLAFWAESSEHFRAKKQVELSKRNPTRPEGNFSR